MPIICPDCGAQQPDGTAFCDMCGADLRAIQGTGQPVTEISPKPPTFGEPPGLVLPTWSSPSPSTPAPVSAAPVPLAESTCHNCGAKLTPGSKFCDMCGALAEEPGLPLGAPAPQQQMPLSSTPGIPQAVVGPSPIIPPSAIPPYAVPTIQGRLIVQSTNAVIPFPAGKSEFIVGREDPASGQFPDIDLSGHGGDEGGVSRRHARIFLQGTQYYIEDLNSTNYTFVNQKRLPPNQPCSFKNGDELRLGRVRLIVAL